jgi:hypothetical protein
MININRIIVFFAVYFFYLQLLLPDEIGFRTAVARIECIQNRIPNDDDFFSICSDNSISLTKQEQVELFGKILMLQKSRTNCQELLAIFNAKRNLLHDVKVSYIESIDIFVNSDLGMRGKTSHTYVFAFSENKMYLARDGKRSPDDYQHSVIASDGEILRTVSLPDNDLANAEITKINSPNYARFFYQLNMPLFLSNIVDENLCGYPRQPGRNIIELLKEKGSFHVFQQEEVIDNQVCIVVLNEYCRFYLSPEKDFSIIRFELFSQKFDPDVNRTDQRRFVGRSLTLRSNFRNYIDNGNGIWTPSVIENSYYLENKQIAFVKIEVKDIQINKRIPDSFFSDVIPDDAFVADGIRNMVYRQSDHPSIDSLLKETAKSKRVFIYRYISVTAGLLMIIIALLLKYRAYLKDKRERENKTEEETA